MSVYHLPVLLEESLEGLSIRSGGVYVDLTFGGGGHSRGILHRLGPEGRLLAFDQDGDARANLPDDSRLTFIESNFRFVRTWLRYYGVERVDGILADLGVSSHHFDTRERGFSFRHQAPLDMRMNQRARLTAADVVNGYDPDRLTAILRDYGELEAPHRVAQCIVRSRAEGPLARTDQLVAAVAPLTPRGGENKFLSKLFQAIRIEVNGELEALKMMLEQTARLLLPGGRLVVITYHSLEDRLVKNYMRWGNFEGRAEQDFYGRVRTPFQLVNHKVILPTPEERERNPRSRSAKLRIAERKNDLEETPGNG